jgi:hypothetical protein
MQFHATLYHTAWCSARRARADDKGGAGAVPQEVAGGLEASCGLWP